MKQEYAVSEKENGSTVKGILSGPLGLSRRTISRLMRERRIMLNGKSCPLTAAVCTGDVIVIRAASDDIGILYEDDDLVIINKPAGIPSHPSAEHPDDHAGVFLKKRYGEDFTIRTVGRLDRQVSGAMLYAKSRKAAALLSAQREEGVLRKIYTAFAEGSFEEPEGIMHYSLGKKKGKDWQALSKEGRECITEYRVTETWKNVSCLSVHIRTGRTHQIRAGMAEAGHPLLGDRLYGGDMVLIRRPALHCGEITFRDLSEGKEITVSCPLPADMEKAMGILRDAAGKSS